MPGAQTAADGSDTERRHRFCPPPDPDAGQRAVLRALLGTCLDRVPDGVSVLSRYDDEMPA